MALVYEYCHIITYHYIVATLFLMHLCILKCKFHVSFISPSPPFNIFKITVSFLNAALSSLIFSYTADSAISVSSTLF